jgi:CBS-domain-containing membrane protein
MTTDVRVVSPEDTLQDAAQLMEDADCGILPVGEDNRVVGMVTDRDITVRGVAQGRTPDECKVRDVMSSDVMYVFEDEPIEDAARNMSDLQLRRLPVVNRDQELVGIISLGDLAVRSGTTSVSGALRKVSQPGRVIDG